MAEIFDNMRNDEDKLFNDLDRCIYKAGKMYSQVEVDALARLHEAAALEKAAQTIPDEAWDFLSHYPIYEPKASELMAYIESKILALLPEAGKLLAERERLARLEEAEWWEHLVGAQHQLEGRHECEPDCMYCEHIAALRKEE